MTLELVEDVSERRVNIVTNTHNGFVGWGEE